MAESLPSYLTIPAESLPEVSHFHFEILPSPAALFQHMAQAIAAEIRSNNMAGRPTRLILPVGPTGQYPLLVNLCNQEGISWKNVHTFNMDEYCDWQGRWLPITHPLSFRGYMERVVFSQLDPGLRIPPDQVHFPDPLNLDVISRKIQEVGGIDTCYGGLGYHGHVAFNEPPDLYWQRVSANEFKQSLTRQVKINPDTIVMNSIRNTGGSAIIFPAMGVTIGMRDILAARRIRLYCPGGAWQRAVLRTVLLGEEDVTYPATLLKGHADVAIFADSDTAQPALPAL